MISPKNTFAPKLMLGLALSLPLTSCASLVTGSSDLVTINSYPQGARFTTNTGHQGLTPAEVEIPDKTTLQVQVELDGYEHAQASLAPRMSGWFLGNIIFGGLIGMGLDLISGNWRVHESKLDVHLVKLEASSGEEAPLLQEAN